MRTMDALVVFESLRPSGEERLSFRIDTPEEILQCNDLNTVESVIREAEDRAQRGCLVAGFVTYEAGYAFVPGLPPARPASLPLAWFAVARDPQYFASTPRSAVPRTPDIGELQLHVSRDVYGKAISAIKEHIERGETYQVNYTARYRGSFAGSPEALYEALIPRQRVNYAALIQTPEWAVVSLSPELFFRKEGFRVRMRPMKGTIARGRTLDEDALQSRALQESPKETSENLMIVDMLRNDLGRICEPGSIEVSDPMQVERYETLLQMTTTIQGRLLPGAGVTSIFRAAFPSGSVTGAPKRRTMQIIHSLEDCARGIYTGAIGYMQGDRAVFNVAIRTVVMDRAQNRLEMGTGSGILYEADAENEYRECLLKGRFLREPHEAFRLFETILWTRGDGYLALELHLERILASARYFLFNADHDLLLRTLRELEVELSRQECDQRVRLLLDAEGRLETQHEPLEPAPPDPQVCLASRTVDSSDRFLFHKTTRRKLYDEELEIARKRGCFDAIFRNERGDITEGTISNIVIRKGSLLLTPPLECGLLAGTCRRSLLESGKIREERLSLQDLRQADEVYLTNALRGMMRVTPILDS